MDLLVFVSVPISRGDFARIVSASAKFEQEPDLDHVCVLRWAGGRSSGLLVVDPVTIDTAFRDVA